ncbi:MAG: hypothetical protein CL578_00745 [Alteromonadaceae bacterium]|uniref:hypothetical protein n=1 Tax=Paraglaciecola chathamensis TaxID=368405 RepID=UPI000C5D0294|nr:hypothetical protein [Paraglaciecola agarilytica]MBN23564.1 hypothetical protein [Alteromonadaceae bacterium]|tara:strand:- start:2560 stop:3378 length:819 start_codon:yes stop_codon:yes gene_type:complete
MLKIITATVTLLYLISFSSSAALMKFSFQGVITGVENTEGAYWDPTSIVGASITGYMIMDTELALGGREEVSYYWWKNIDSDPGALSTNFDIADVNYGLSSQYDFNAMYDSYVTDEFLEYGGGIDENGKPIADHMGLRDTEQYEESSVNHDLFYSKKFSFGISDIDNEFLTDFRPVPGQSEPQPDWLQEYVWTDDGSLNNGKSGGGSYRYFETHSDLATNQTSRIDSTLTFSFSQVTAEQITAVPSPATLWFTLSAFAFLLSRSRALKTHLH